jgi:WD40 repeat protein
MTENGPTGKRASVFISYARSDGAFADRVRQALIARGFEAFLDREDILPGEDWRARLEGLIVAADGVVFVISPDSIASPHCQWEVQRAVELQKTVAPVRWLPVPDDAWPAGLRSRHAVLFDVMQGGAAFRAGIDKLEIALEVVTHLWVREHSKWAARATDWDRSNPPRPEGKLMRTADVASLTAWMSVRPPESPAPPQVVLDYLDASVAKEDRDRQELFTRERRISATLQMLCARAAQEAMRQRRFDRALRLSLAAEPSADERARDIPSLPMRRAVMSAGAQALACRARFMGTYKDRVMAVALSDDGKLAASAASSGKLRLWEVASGRELDGLDRGFSAGYEEDARVTLEFAERCVMDRGIALLLDGDGATVRFAPRSNQPGRVIASVNGAKGLRLLIEWHDVRDGSGRPICTLPVNPYVHWDAAIFAPDGRHLVTVDNGAREHRGTAFVWDVETGKEVARLQCGADRNAHGLRFTPSGARYLVMRRGSQFALFDASTWCEFRRFELQAFRDLEISPDGLRLLATAPYAPLRCIEIGDMRELFSIAAQQGPAVFDSGGTRVAAGFASGEVRLLDAATGDEIESFIGHEEAVNSVVFSANGDFILSGSDDGAARLWQIGGRRPRFHVTAPIDANGLAQSYRSAQFSADGELLAAICSDQSATVWELRSGALRCELRGHTGTLNAITFNPNGTSLATCAGAAPMPHKTGRNHDPKDKTARLWDVTTGRQIACLEADAGVLAIAFSPDGSALVTGLVNGNAEILDVASGVRRLNWKAHSGAVHDVAFSADGTRVLTASGDESARVWDSVTATLACTLWGWGEQRDPELKARAAAVQSIEMVQSIDVPVTCARFSPDGRRVVTHCACNVIVWDAVTGAIVARLTKPEGGLASSFSPDGQRIISAAGVHLDRPLAPFMGDVPSARIAKVWNVSDGSEQARLETHHDIRAVGFSPDGARAVTSSGDETVLWDVASGVELARFPGFCVGEEGVGRGAVATTSAELNVWDASWALRRCDDDLVARIVRERMLGMLCLTPDELLILEPILGPLDPMCLDKMFQDSSRTKITGG